MLLLGNERICAECEETYHFSWVTRWRYSSYWTILEDRVVLGHPQMGDFGVPMDLFLEIINRDLFDH